MFGAFLWREEASRRGFDTLRGGFDGSLAGFSQQSFAPCEDRFARIGAFLTAKRDASALTQIGTPENGLMFFAGNAVLAEVRHELRVALYNVVDQEGDEFFVAGIGFLGVDLASADLS